MVVLPMRRCSYLLILRILKRPARHSESAPMTLNKRITRQATNHVVFRIFLVNWALRCTSPSTSDADCRLNAYIRGQMNDTLMRQWAMLRLIPRFPRRIDTPTIHSQLLGQGMAHCSTRDGVKPKVSEIKLTSLGPIAPVLLIRRARRCALA